KSNGLLLRLNGEIKNQLVVSYEEQGRQELLNGNAQRASIYLSEAYKQGGNNASLRFLLAQSMRNIDAQLLTLECHKATVASASFSPDGKLIVTASYDKTIKIWDAETGKELSSFKDDDAVNSAAFSPDGKRIVTTNLKGSSKVWSIAAGKPLARFEYPA